MYIYIYIFIYIYKISSAYWNLLKESLFMRSKKRFPLQPNTITKTCVKGNYSSVACVRILYYGFGTSWGIGPYSVVC